MASDLLVGMLCAGLKATRIAHVCREKKELFEILIQEKGKLKNNVTDFKTLADVFIQQVAQNEIQEKFPPIGNKVYGEENNEFTNTLGESITVEIKPTMDETASLLARVLDGNEVASRLLAAEAHSNVQDQIETIDIKDFEQMSQISMDVENIGVWIDPIDGTAQYVGGVSQEKKDKYGVYGKGLQCVTVLIGAYNTVTGLPIMGVVYQPFFEEAKTEDGNKYWKYRCFWGLSYKNTQINNVKSLHEVNMKQRAHDTNHVIITSPHDEEAHEIIRSCENVQYCTGGGAGYKCLCAIEGLVEGYLYNGDACYKWDTCATQAILMSLGGCLVSLSFAKQLFDANEIDALNENLQKHQLTYHKANQRPNPPWANVGGILAIGASHKSLKSITDVLLAANNLGI